MTRTYIITPQQADEVKRLLAEYLDAVSKAGAALGCYSTDPDAPETASRQDLRAAAAYRRIREIYGDEATRISGSSKPSQIK